MAINERAMLVRLRISQWSGTKLDSSVSAEVADRHNAERSAGSYSKKLVDGSLLSDFKTVAGAAYMYHNSMTLPWMEGGWRILPIDLYQTYLRQMGRYKTEAENVAIGIGKRYDDFLVDARRRLGTLYLETDFPARDDLVSKFSIGTSLSPVQSADFRVAIGKEDEDLIRQQVQEEIGESIKAASGELWGRVETTLTHLHEQLADTNKRVMQQSFTALSNLVETLPKLNLFGDKDLDALADLCREKLCKFQVSALREDESERSRAATEAAEVMAKMRGFMKAA